MAKYNLAHHEQILKSFEHSLKEICEQHKQAHDALIESQIHHKLARVHLAEAWTQVLYLFVKVEQLKSTRPEFEKESQ